MVEFRVTDIHNNTNTCMVNVEVFDKLDPIIDCPKDATYECSTYNHVASDFPIDGLNQDGYGAPAYYVDADWKLKHMLDTTQMLMTTVK